MSTPPVRRHVIVTAQIRVNTGPTTVGDVDSEPGLMADLGAQLTQQLGQPFAEYITAWPARRVLDRLAASGYRVIASCGVGQTCIWTLEKEDQEVQDQSESRGEAE